MPDSGQPTITFTMLTPSEARRRDRRRRLARIGYAAGVLGAFIVPSPLGPVSTAAQTLADISAQAITLL